MKLNITFLPEEAYTLINLGPNKHLKNNTVILFFLDASIFHQYALQTVTVLQPRYTTN
jgi:hypothetical protein